MDAILLLARREVLAAWRYRWFAIALAWVVCLAGWAMVVRIPSVYEADARLYIDVDAVLTPLLRGIEVDSGLASQLELLQRTLLSRPNLERVIAKTDLDLTVNSPADLDSLVQRLGRDIHVVPQTRNLFSISYSSRNPRLAYDVVRTVLDLFIESKAGINASELANARAFLQQQLDSYETQLRDAEKQRAEFRAKYVGLLPNDEGVTQYEQAQNAVAQLKGQLQDATSSRTMLQNELAATPEFITGQQAAAVAGPAPVNPALQQAEQNLAELKLRYTEQFPDVKIAEALVRQLRAAGTQAAPGATTRPGSSLANPLFQQIKNKLFDLNGQILSLQRRLDEATDQQNRLAEVARAAPGLQAQFTNMNRDYDVLRHNYEELLERRESMRIAAAAQSDADNIRTQVVDPPIIPQTPTGPQRAPMLSVVLLAGLGAGVGLAVLLVRLDSSFHSVDELRAIGLPVIGGISIALEIDVARSPVRVIAPVAMTLILLVGTYYGLLTHISQISDRI